ncbi:MAG TPA: hypothetical protein VGS02_07905 [Acidobacteriaceae bacterium]|nr:hypothetical protein [Acidobacteriaceae bacterium]
MYLNILNTVSNRMFQVAAALVLLFATLTPLANCFDTWDKNPAPANDTEMHLAAWFAGAGLVLVIARTTRAMPVPAKTPHRIRLSRAAAPADGRLLDVLPESTASPPLIPLRI